MAQVICPLWAEGKTWAGLGLDRLSLQVRGVGMPAEGDVYRQPLYTADPTWPQHVPSHPQQHQS